jgi:hypothetical protein
MSATSNATVKIKRIEPDILQKLATADQVVFRSVVEKPPMLLTTPTTIVVGTGITNVTLTQAQLQSGFIILTGASVGFTLKPPTESNMAANCQAGSLIKCIILNSSGQTATISANGTSIAGDTALATTKFAEFTVLVTAVGNSPAAVMLSSIYS